MILFTVIILMNIKQLREKTNLSQSKFAKKFHINVRTLQRWEQGQTPTPDYVVFMIGRILELEEKLDG